MPVKLPPVELQPFDSDNFLPPIEAWTRWGANLLLGTFGMAVVAAGLIPYSPTVKASGVVQPFGNPHFVRAATEGRVKQIRVRENQTLEAGEEIASVNPSGLKAEWERLEEELRQLQEELTLIGGYIETLDHQILTLWKSKRRSRRQNESISVEVAVVELTESDPEVAQELARERRSLLKQQWELQRDLDRAEKQFQRVKRHIDDPIIRAPIGGTVIRLDLPRPGDAIAADAIVAQMMPPGATLTFTARVAEDAIAPIQPGQTAYLRLGAYPVSEYGTLRGIVERIAKQPVGGGDGGEARATYEVTVRPETPYFPQGDRQYPLRAGMAGRADIVVGQETVLTFALKKVRLWTAR
ncbi:MAG: HlyD family secretion protein [Limnospira sp.]